MLRGSRYRVNRAASFAEVYVRAVLVDGYDDRGERQQRRRRRLGTQRRPPVHFSHPSTAALGVLAMSLWNSFRLNLTELSTSAAHQ